MNGLQQKIEENRLFFVLLVLAVWTAFGLFFGTQNYVRDAYSGKAGALPAYLFGWLICGYSWGVLTVPALRFVRRFSLPTLGWSRFLLLHIPAGVVFASVQLGLYTLITAAIALTAGAPSRSLVEFYEQLFVKEFQSSFLVYLAIVASVTVYRQLFDQSEGVDGSDAFGVRELAINEDVRNLANLHNHGSENGNRYVKRIPVKDNGRIVLVDVDGVDWIESYGNYVFLHTAGSRHMLRETMTGIEAKLDPQQFLRIRRSAIVRADRIEEMRAEQNGEYEIRLKGGQRVTSTRRYRQNLETVLKV